jgi:hypothetical protein
LKGGFSQKKIKNHLSIALILSLYFNFSKAQYSNSFGNYYAPFHKQIKDTLHKTVSKFGHYVSFGVGSARDYGIGGVGLLTSYSLAYKNNLFTMTYGGASVPFLGGSANESNFR